MTGGLWRYSAADRTVHAFGDQGAHDSALVAALCGHRALTTCATASPIGDGPPPTWCPVCVRALGTLMQADDPDDVATRERHDQYRRCRDD